jgi:hypothetical protein
LRARREPSSTTRPSEIAVVAVEQVQVAFGIDDAEIVADDDRSAGKADGKLVLFPDRPTGRLVERMEPLSSVT